MKLLVTFTQTGGKNMILPTVQLLRVALITRLLLLIPLTGLLMKATLIALTLETEIRTATAVTRTVRAGT